MATMLERPTFAALVGGLQFEFVTYILPARVPYKVVCAYTASRSKDLHATNTHTSSRH